MPIEFSCKCGLLLSVEAEYAGQDVQCPTCNAIVKAPKPAVKKAKPDPEPDNAPLKLLDEPEQSKPEKKRRVQTKSKSDKFSASDYYDEQNRKKVKAEKEIEESYEKERKRTSWRVITGFGMGVLLIILLIGYGGHFERYNASCFVVAMVFFADALRAMLGVEDGEE